MTYMNSPNLVWNQFIYRWMNIHDLHSFTTHKKPFNPFIYYCLSVTTVYIIVYLQIAIEEVNWIRHCHQQHITTSLLCCKLNIHLYRRIIDKSQYSQCIYWKVSMKLLHSDLNIFCSFIFIHGQLFQ